MLIFLYFVPHSALSQICDKNKICNSVFFYKFFFKKRQKILKTTKAENCIIAPKITEICKFYLNHMKEQCFLYQKLQKIFFTRLKNNGKTFDKYYFLLANKKMRAQSEIWKECDFQQRVADRTLYTVFFHFRCAFNAPWRRAASERITLYIIML